INGSCIVTRNHYRCQGVLWDADLGCFLLRVRYLDPDSGRCLTADSWAGDPPDPLSLHRYLAFHDNPVNRVDPSGNFDYVQLAITVGIQGSIGAFVSAGIDYAVHRELKRAAKAGGWGFIIGGTLGGAFQGIKALLVVRGAATALDVTVTTASTELITATTDGALIGVIDEAGVIQLFKSGPGVFI